MRNAIVKTGVLAILFLTTSSLVASASDSTNVRSISSEITYLGAFNRDELLFKVKFNNVQDVPCHFIIKDQEGFILFEQWFSGGNFTKKFLIQMETVTSANLSFSYSTENDTHTETFAVSAGDGGKLVATRL